MQLDVLKNKSPVLRPHMKTHKCPLLAKMQIAEGAVGITFAEISEAQQPGSLSRIAGQYDPGGCVLWANRGGEA